MGFTPALPVAKVKTELKSNICQECYPRRGLRAIRQVADPPIG